MNRHQTPECVLTLGWILLLVLSVPACNIPQAPPEIHPPTEPGTLTDTSLPAPTLKATSTFTPPPTPLPSELVWYAPNMGSRDYPDLFTKPEQWSAARSRINVFKFYTQNVLPYPCAICGANTLDTLIAANAFETLSQWGIATAVEVGAVKEWGCNGTEEFRVTREAMQNIRNHGGEVTFLDMDEPYMGGELMANGNTCGYTMEQTADVTAKYMRLVRDSYPNLIVGETEPYPYFSVSQLEKWIEALEARQSGPAYFHLDVNLVEGGRRRDDARVRADLQTLSSFFQEHGIVFGVIFTANADWGAQSGRAYYESTQEWLRLVRSAIGRPQHVVFQSWLGPAPGGAHEVPINLPEDDPSTYSHTRLILDGLAVLGQ